MPNLPAVPRPALAPKQKNYIVVCARYVPEKRLDDTIRALKIVAEANPDMRADFFGAGVEKQKLVALCRELGLSEVVKINDFTASPLDAFATAQCTIMTSKHEGLPLTLQECLSVGTPTVAYDIRYGPAHLIEDGVTGYLVPDGDVAGVAQRVIEILANPDKAHAMAQAALNASHRFSEQAYRQAWQEALDEMFAGSEENDSQIKPSSWLARAKKYFAA